MSPQEIRLLSSEAIRAKIEELKQTAQLMSTHPAEGHQLVSVVKTRTEKTIAELEDILFSRG